MGCLKLTYYGENEPLLKCVWNKNGAEKPVQWFYTVDPLAEKHIEWSPYAYCLNNPILRFDPNGLTDFTFDKKTGDVNQVVFNCVNKLY